MNIEKPKLLIIAGPNGSGKTTVTEQILKHSWRDGCEYINPDIVAKDMFGDWNSTEAIMNAANYTTNLRNKLIEDNKSLIFETVLSTIEKISFIEYAKKQGYFIRLFFVGTDSPEINASRVTKRVLNGGHDVPINKIISRYSKSIANCAFIVPIIDRLYVYDNSIENEEAKLLFRANDGKLVKKYCKINHWSEIIYKQLTK